VSRLPYAVLPDGAGVPAPRAREQPRAPESLFEARERGVASLQDWLRREDDDGGEGAVRR
jgi:hypothetical protein